VTPATPTKTIIEWHRPMGKHSVAWPLGIGAFLMTVGGLCVLLTLPRATTVPYLSAVGGACMVTAFLVVVISLMRRAGMESCLILRRDAIVLERDEKETVLLWSDVKAIRVGEGGAIDVERTDGTVWTMDEGFSKPDELASRMEEVRRKTSFGLI
jgi:hypothetical protein